LPDVYKDYIFVSGYYNYISKNRGLFKVHDDFDFLCVLNNIEVSPYMGEGPLLNKLLLNYLNYYKNYLNNLSEAYLNAGLRLNGVCDEILKESGNVITHLSNISKILNTIIINKYDDSESLLLTHLSKITSEFSFFKGIFSNFNKTLKNISAFNDNTVADLNNAKKKNISSNVIFFNNENLLKYISESNLDMEHFSESSKLLKEISSEHNKMLEKLISLDKKLDSDYIYIEHSDYYNDMWADAHEINRSANYHYKLKRGAGFRFKRTTFEESLALIEEIKVIDKRIIRNNMLLNEYSVFIANSISDLKGVEKNVNKCVVALKRLDECISKGKP
jgi:hypothetical protein